MMVENRGMVTHRCWECQRYARLEDCVLRRHKRSGIRRYFHDETSEPACVNDIGDDWEEVDPSLGETTEEEEFGPETTAYLYDMVDECVADVTDQVLAEAGIEVAERLGGLRAKWLVAKQFPAAFVLLWQTAKQMPYRWAWLLVLLTSMLLFSWWDELLVLGVGYRWNWRIVPAYYIFEYGVLTPLLIWLAVKTYPKLNIPVSPREMVKQAISASLVAIALRWIRRRFAK